MSGSRRNRERRWRPEVFGLEERRLFYIAPDKIILMAHPAVLSPPNGQYVPVTVTGSLDQSSGVVPKGFFFVTGQYGEVAPHGDVALHGTSDPNRFSFSFTISLQAKRGSQTPNGRQYDILVGGTDKDGTAGKTIAVWVPKEPRSHRATARAHRGGQAHPPA